MSNDYNSDSAAILKTLKKRRNIYTLIWLGMLIVGSVFSGIGGYMTNMAVI